MRSSRRRIGRRERVAVVFFGVVLILMRLMLIVLGRYAEREGLFGEDAGEERKEDARVKYQLAAEPHLLRGGGGLGLLLPSVGVVIYLLIAIYLAIPIRDVTRLYQRKA